MKSEDNPRLKPHDHSIVDIISMFLFFTYFYQWFGISGIVSYCLFCAGLLLSARSYIFLWLKKILLRENADSSAKAPKNQRSMTIIEWSFFIIWVFSVIPWFFLGADIGAIIGYCAILILSIEDIRLFFTQFHSGGVAGLFSKKALYCYGLLLFGIVCILFYIF